MTGGVVAVLGETGRNVAAGMTGGVLFLYDVGHRVKGRMAESAPRLERLRPTDAELLLRIVREHHRRTGSPRAEDILDHWTTRANRFWVLRPEPPATGASHDREVSDTEPTDVVAVDAAVAREHFAG